MAPTSTLTIDGLDPGTYSIAVEGLWGGEVVSFGEAADVVVQANRNTATTVAQGPFVSTLTDVPAQLAVGNAVVVQFGAVSGAVSYRIEWDGDPTFPAPRSLETDSTTVRISHPSAGSLHVRVRATNRFGSIGSASTVGTITIHDIWTQVAAGSWHSCGLRSSSEAYCWGSGESGLLGNGFFSSLRPEKVGGGLLFFPRFLLGRLIVAACRRRARPTAGGSVGAASSVTA
jgi:hypothetical protein